MDSIGNTNRNLANTKSWKAIRSSTMAKNTINPIRRIVDGMKLTPNPEKEMIALSIGDPTVFGNLPVSNEMNEAVIQSILTNKRNGYAPSVGYEDSRTAVANQFSCPEAPLTAKDVILTSGCSGAIEIALNALANPGQNVLIPRPGFSLYRTLADSVGIKTKYYDLMPDRSWEINLEHLKSLIDTDTVAIVVNNPSNPCGSVWPRQHILDILDIADRHHIPLISDEVYADFVFPGHEFISMASQTSTVPILTCGGLTKRYLVPGWRMGWILVHDRNDLFRDEIRPGLTALSQRILGPNTLIQGALKTIFETTPEEFFELSIQTVKRNADICFLSMNNIRGLKPIMPAGAMYMMIAVDMQKFPEFSNDLEFTERLVVEQSVFCLPAQCFQYPNYFRVVLTVPEDKLKEACCRIEEFCKQHYSEDDVSPNVVTNGTA